MITPIWTMKISEIVERHEDLLVSADDIKELAKNERKKAIDEFAERIRDWQKEIYQNGKYARELDFLFKHIDEIATELKGE